jgi:DNA invertase Pin-like site-specific DNA recombinase
MDIWPDLTMTNYIGYARVSTDKQGRSGLGLEAQEATIRRHLRDDDKLLLPIMVEVESGRRSDRPVLLKALERCRMHKATLLVAKLDRLARNRDFVSTVMKSGVSVEFCDIPASKGATGAFLLGIMAEVAQLEAGLISERTKAALAAAKARGVKLGGWRGGPKVDPTTMLQRAAKGWETNREKACLFAERVAPMAREMRDAGMSFGAIADAFAAQGIVTPRGGTSWTATAVRRVLMRCQPDGA